jgi:hypothetical protein
MFQKGFQSLKQTLAIRKYPLFFSLLPLIFFKDLRPESLWVIFLDTAKSVHIVKKPAENILLG